MNPDFFHSLVSPDIMPSVAPDAAVRLINLACKYPEEDIESLTSILQRSEIAAEASWDVAFESEARVAREQETLFLSQYEHFTVEKKLQLFQQVVSAAAADNRALQRRSRRWPVCVGLGSLSSTRAASRRWSPSGD